eukprot:scaffold21331_cov117-Isochrysis_galbana.AAC.2
MRGDYWSMGDTVRSHQCSSPSPCVLAIGALQCLRARVLVCWCEWPRTSAADAGMMKYSRLVALWLYS